MKENKPLKNSGKQYLLSLLLVVSLGIAVFAALQIFRIQASYSDAESEYTQLQKVFHAPPAGSITTGQPSSSPSLQEMNPDYVGWIQIEGTAIDYPVAQGKTNNSYLRTTFEGKSNPMGAIFLDSACPEGLASAHVLIYGHNAKDGSMFAALMAYSNPDFLAEHPVILLTLPDGTTKKYRVLAARVTDASDPLYASADASFEDTHTLASLAGISQDLSQLLTLSTCTNSSNELERMLVFATPET